MLLTQNRQYVIAQKWAKQTNEMTLNTKIKDLIRKIE
jgi:hypothetical protein